MFLRSFLLKTRTEKILFVNAVFDTSAGTHMAPRCCRSHETKWICKESASSLRSKPAAQRCTVEGALSDDLRTEVLKKGYRLLPHSIDLNKPMSKERRNLNQLDGLDLKRRAQWTWISLWYPTFLWKML